MNSEGSCDTEDWSNNWRKYILKYIQIENCSCNNITVFVIFFKMNAALASV